jgi:hypothetical protein
MQLGSEDQIFFSDLSYDSKSAYQNRIQAGYILPMTQEELMEQEKTISDGLYFSVEMGTPHISKYDINEFLY